MKLFNLFYNKESRNSYNNVQNLLRSIPSGAAIDKRGDIKIIFTLSEPSFEYLISKRSIDEFIAFKSDELPRPSAPIFQSSTTNSVTVKWSENQLPFPPGITQRVELQYSRLESPQKWVSLGSKPFYLDRFFEFSLLDQSAGSSFRFRIKYTTDSSLWSAFSPPSEPVSTLPDRPPRPASPDILAITSYSAELSWSSHRHRHHRHRLLTNGSPLTAFVLRGRSVGDVFTTLYRGSRTRFLAMDLFPEFAYSFQLAAENELGVSEFSDLVSFQTPVKPRSVSRSAGLINGFPEYQVLLANNCPDAWTGLLFLLSNKKIFLVILFL
jgi:hypothetical protein